MSPFGIASRGSFKRQIILTFVVGFFGLAVSFAAYMVSSERANVYRDSREMATGLGQSLAVSSLAWVLANDVVGMQEVVGAFRNYPEMRYVLIISPTGRVLAHSDSTKVGQYIADEATLSLLRTAPEVKVMRDDDNVIDVAVPVAVGERHVGWARIAMGREAAAKAIQLMVWNVSLFVVCVTILFFFVSAYVLNRLGRRIDSLVSVANEVRAGNFDTRVSDVAVGDDEIARLAGSLNLMLDTLSRNEAQLRSVSHYTRSLIEASLDPLVTISPEGKITDVNLATEMVTGRSREELVGTDFSEYFTEPDKARAGYREVFAQGSVTNYALAIRHRDGHVTDVLYNASVFRNEAGEVQGVFAAARDISEQQRAVLLRAQLAAIVESSNDAIIGKTLDGTITSWNKGAEKIYGYRDEEIIGKPVTLLAPAAQHAEIQRLLETVRNGGTVQNYESERQRKDGSRIQVAITLSPIRDATGKVSGISTIARDISEQKSMELERTENLRYFESMDRVNRAMQQAKDLEGMLNDVLGEVLDIFDCDRVGLVYPCDPTSPTWQIVMERAKPGFSTEPLRGPLPMSEVRAESMRWLLEKNGPVQFMPQDDPEQLRQKSFGIRSFMSMAVRPRFGNIWEFGIHQCTYARKWTAQEAKLFEEIARRLADGLNIMLANRDLRESERRYHQVFENSPVSIWEEDFSAVKALLDELKQQGVTDLDAWFTRHPETIVQCAQATKILDVNSAAIGLHGASSKEALLAGLVDTFTQESFETFRRELVSLWNGGTQMAEDAVVKTLDGELRHVTIYFGVCPGYETTWGKVIVSLVDITDRKQAEEQIRQSEARYRTLIQNIQAAVVVHAADTRILVANVQAQEILGLTAEQLQGRTAIDPDWHFFREDGKPAAIEEYPVNRVLATGLAIRSQVMGVHRPGGKGDVWVLVNADPVFDKDGVIVQIIITFIDISERKQMEEALRESEERFRGMFEKHHAVMLLIEPGSGKIIDANQAAADYYGYPLETLRCMVIQDINMLSPEQIAQERQRAAHEERSYFVFPHRLASGEIRTVEVHSSPIIVQGKPLLFSITHDITERKQAEEGLKRMNERFAQATRAAELGVWDWDIPNNQLVWDNSMYRLYGIPEGTFGGAYEAWARTIHPEDKEYTEGEIQAALRGEREYAPEFRIIRPDGSIRYLKAVSQTFRDEDGKPLRMIGTNIDITERKRMEKALEVSEQEFRSLAESSPDFIIRYDPEHRMRYLNRALVHVLGLANADEVIGKQPIKVWPDGRFASIDEVAARVIKTGNAETIESWVPVETGEYRFHQILVVAERDVAGQIIGTIAFGRDITERKQAEEALRREQGLLNRVMETSPVGIAVVDKTGQVTFANPQAEKILGLSKEKITQLSYNAPEWHSTAIDGGPFPDEAQPFSLVMSTRQPVFDVQHAIAWPDGHRVLLSINGAPLFDAKGEIEGVAFAIEDITERKQADEALHRNEQSLIEAQRIAHLGSWHMDLATNEVFWSEELYKMYGFDPALPPPPYNESMKLFTPESWEKLSNAIARAVETGASYELELEMVPRDGGRKWMMARGELVRDEHGKAVEVRGVVMDITARKEAEVRLVASESRLRTVVETEPECIKVVDAKGRLRQMNPAGLAMIEAESLDQVAGRSVFGLIAPEYREAYAQLHERVIAGEPQKMEYIMIGLKGKPLWLETHAVPMRDGGEVVHLAVTRDITERKRAEEEVHQLNRDLEQRVAERTEQLEVANKELESFSYSVSHDLRSPLRAIDGFSHILLEDYTDKLDDEGRRMLSIVRENTQRMGQLIDDILKFSRSGRTEINTVEVDMAALAREVLDELRLGDASAANLCCTIGELPPARCDRALIHQVFANLISNAIKFSRTRETPTIDVGGSIEGDEIVYHVKDNGVGFDMQYADKLFGVFQRLHSMEEFEGTGIGLAIVKRIVARHGGRVWAESKVGEGATFYFALPVKEKNHE
jgi:PAS domain S-box-containing protein